MGQARLAVDIGGTFTDVVLEKAGQYHARKVLTTPENPSLGFLDGTHQVLQDTGTSPSEIGLILHGTTLATNALIERKGAKTALVVTEGHRDSLEIAYENRFDQYDINAERPRPLVPRFLRWPVRERVDWRGEVLMPLDGASVEALVAKIQDHQIESLAIGLLHAYANPAHEEQVAELLQRACPEVQISLASQVCPEVREYERLSTTCANAYVRPLMSGYLSELTASLDARGFTAPCLLMTSGGNLVTLETAAAFPVRLIESGPAGGAILASAMARDLGEDRVVSFDMGGTTAKICLIDEGEPLLSRTFEVDRAHRFMKGSGLPVKIPVVEMVEIGAGGGSVAQVDGLKRLTVGPESAGSDPGPACYGRGGQKPTVTDANLVMGRLAAKDFAGGSFDLSEGLAESCLLEDVGNPLGLDARGAAQGVIEIVDENMASAARVHAVERGKEIADRTMIAFGGAAPLHATRLAEKLGIEKVVVPANAGVGSAVGFLQAPIAYEVVRSRYMKLAEFDADRLNALFQEMRSEAEAIVRLGAPNEALIEQRHAYARYLGQGHEIKIALPDGKLKAGDFQALLETFEQEYAAQYHRTVPGSEVEVLTWSLTLSTARPLPNEDYIDAPSRVEAEASGKREMLFPGAGETAAAKVFARADLAPGSFLAGPAVITEAQTTTVVASGYEASINRRGDLILTRQADAAAQAQSASEMGTIEKQVMWNRMISIVEEQAQALIRTAFSTSVREAGDLSAGIFDRKGRMLAQAVTGTPGHVNAMAASVNYFIDHIKLEQMHEGDVYVTNDPWMGTGHLFDFTVVTPAFREGRVIALFAATVHVVDIGGRGFGPDAGQVYEEGLCIPILPLFSAGVANQTLFEIVKANVREPVQVVGDLYSLASSNDVGVARLLEMMAEFGLSHLEVIGEYLVERSYEAMMSEIQTLKPGRYRNAVDLDGYDKPLRLEAEMCVGPDGVDIDFTGTSPVSSFGINVPLTYTQAYASFGVRSVVGSAVPNNAGSLAPIRANAPEGCILNAPRPSAVAIRHVIGQMLPDLVLGCLDQAVPGRVPAEGSASLWNPMMSGGHGIVGDSDYGSADPFSVTIFHSGGTGARPSGDGLSATAFPSGVRNTPVEITETIAPLTLWRKEYRPDSGGAGRYRGGLGQVIEIEHKQQAPFAVFALFERIENPARGRHGGLSGQGGRIALADGGKLKGMGKQIIPPGQRLVLELPGGAGYGAPEGRAAEALSEDLRNELVSPKAAKDLYGHSG
ncbi:MAG: hydantoinase B/oxoprolinase family protein [Pseudomonadota bacterium]